MPGGSLKVPCSGLSNSDLGDLSVPQPFDKLGSREIQTLALLWKAPHGHQL